MPILYQTVAQQSEITIRANTFVAFALLVTLQLRKFVHKLSLHSVPAMPPLRTTKKNQSAVNSKSLLAYGFRGTPDRATNFRGCGMSADPSVDVTSPTTPTTQSEPASKSALPKPGSTKLLGKGERIAEFRNNTHDWDGKYHLKIGTSTRRITLSSGFALEK